MGKPCEWCGRNLKVGFRHLDPTTCIAFLKAENDALRDRAQHVIEGLDWWKHGDPHGDDPE